MSVIVLTQQETAINPNVAPNLDDSAFLESNAQFSNEVLSGPGVFILLLTKKRTPPNPIVANGGTGRANFLAYSFPSRDISVAIRDRVAALFNWIGFGLGLNRNAKNRAILLMGNVGITNFVALPSYSECFGAIKLRASIVEGEKVMRKIIRQKPRLGMFLV
ncbi:unnamed protein product [Citrullus colocynthis]|uniref:Uncharacterized protein n=1 Tax=Citrullus colocynthis TaxID=252529 RepID=A0ABP0Z4P8_9ROSI